LRWNFVFQRPQHLMSRFAREMDVIYWEEPVEIAPRETAYLQVREAQDTPRVRIVIPHLPQGMPEDAREAALGRLLDTPEQITEQTPRSFEGRTLFDALAEYRKTVESDGWRLLHAVARRDCWPGRTSCSR
jgi:hypothetical protein